MVKKGISKKDTSKSPSKKAESSYLKYLNFKEVKEFLNETTTALVAFSIFLTILMNIFEASYLKEGEVYHQITIFLLFFITLLIGFFIMGYSTKYNNFFIKILGISVFIFPIFFISFLSDGLQQILLQGGYIVLMILSITLSAFTMNLLLKILQNKVFKNSTLFALICLISAVILFIVIKYTQLVSNLAKFIVSIIPFNYLPDTFQILTWGIVIGIIIGLVLAPAYAFIRKFFPTGSLK
jgi:hypothetical protein